MYKVGQKLETQDAVKAHTEMLVRMIKDGQGIALNDNLMKDLGAYFKGSDAFNAYADGNYDSSGDYWKLMNDGSLVNDNKGWLVDENGNPIKNAEGKQIGADGVETGLLNILFGGTSGVKYGKYDESQIKFVQDLMTSSGMAYTEGKDGKIQSRSWGGNQQGQSLNMAHIMNYAGNSVAAQVFARYYDSTVDSQIATTMGKNIGNTTTQWVPEGIAGRYTSLYNAKDNFYNSAGSFVNDSLGYYISGEFGATFTDSSGVKRYKDYNYLHFGEDFARGDNPEGDPIYAGLSGQVTYRNRNTENNGKNLTLEYGFSFEGNFVGSGIYGDYYHMKEDPSYKVGDIVSAVTQIGKVGDTGVGSGAHLHYDMFTKGGGYHSETTLRMLVGNSYMNSGNTITSVAGYWELGRYQTQANTRTVYKPSLYYKNSLGYDMARPKK